MANLFLRTYPVGGEQRIAEWSMDVTEAFCEVSRGIIADGVSQCQMHMMDADACPTAYRTPPECQHEPSRLDPGASAGELRCLDCGLTGRDVTTDWRERLRGTASPLVSSEGGSEEIDTAEPSHHG